MVQAEGWGLEIQGGEGMVPFSPNPQKRRGLGGALDRQTAAPP